MLKHKREHCVFANFSVFPFSPIPLFPTLNHKPTTDRYRQCLPLCRRAAGDIGEVARLSRRGWPSAAKRLFCKFDKTATLISFEPLRFLRKHLPYPRYRAAEEDIAASPNLAIQLPYLQRFYRTFVITRPQP